MNPTTLNLNLKTVTVEGRKPAALTRACRGRSTFSLSTGTGSVNVATRTSVTDTCTSTTSGVITAPEGALVRSTGATAQQQRPHVLGQWNDKLARWQYPTCHVSGANTLHVCGLCRGPHSSQWCCGERCCFVCGALLQRPNPMPRAVTVHERAWPNRRCVGCAAETASVPGAALAVTLSGRPSVYNAPVKTQCAARIGVPSKFAVLADDSDLEGDDGDSDSNDASVSVASAGPDAATGTHDAPSTPAHIAVHASVSEGTQCDGVGSRSAHSGSHRQCTCQCSSDSDSDSTAGSTSSSSLLEDVVSTSCLRGSRLADAVRSRLPVHRALPRAPPAAAGELEGEAVPVPLAVIGSANVLTEKDAVARCVRAMLDVCTATGALSSACASWTHALEFGSLLRVFTRERACGAVVLCSIQAYVMSSPALPLDVEDCRRNEMLQRAFADLLRWDVVQLADVREWMTLTTASGTSAPCTSNGAMGQWLTDVGLACLATAENSVSVSVGASLTGTPVVSDGQPLGPSAAANNDASAGAGADVNAGAGVEPTLGPGSWDGAHLSDALMSGLAAMAYDAPSVVQQRVIPSILMGKDVVAQAPSGTGKTCAFALPALQGVDVRNRRCQVIVMVPTWELVTQVVRTFESLCSAMPARSLLVMGCTGGGDAREEAAKTRSGVHVIVTTPGRLLKLLQWSAIQLEHVKTLVIDEADDMLARFGDDVKSVFGHLTSTRDFHGQVVLTSATVSDDMLATCRAFLRPTETVVFLSEKQHTVPRCLSHFVVDMGRHDSAAKVDALLDVLSLHAKEGSGGQTIVFCNATSRVQNVVDDLRRHGVSASEIYGGMEPERRQSVMAELTAGTCTVLVTTDVLARGVDVQGVSMVVNFDMPVERHGTARSTPESAVATYIHRVGRAGRFGRRGMAVSLVQSYRDQLEALARVNAVLHTPMTPMLT
jgi:superfamily II DNA/RNA helicase